MTRRSLHIGLNAVDPNRYDGWDGRLSACENDARSLYSLCHGFEYDEQVKLFTREATIDVVHDEIISAARMLKSGDMFCGTYSGHGGQIPDLTGDEPDGYDETLCMYDGQILDDQFYSWLASFAEGVRVLWLFDSCHSQSVARGRAVPRDVALRLRRVRPVQYRGSGYEIKASVITLSACADNQTASDGPVNGLFTESVLNAMTGFTGGYKRFMRRVAHEMPSYQSPKLTTYGPADSAFLNSTPFRGVTG